MTTARLEDGKWEKQPKKYYTEMKNKNCEEPWINNLYTLILS